MFGQSFLFCPRFSLCENLLKTLRLQWSDPMRFFPLADTLTDLHSLIDRLPQGVIQFIYLRPKPVEFGVLQI